MRDDPRPVPSSPFRYPGGKGWFAPHLLSWLRTRPVRPQLFVEPFAGGASASLAVAHAGLVPQVVMIEKDPDVATVWRTALAGGAEAIIDRVLAFPGSLDALHEALAGEPADDAERAFRLLLRNRVSRRRHLHPDAPLKIRCDHRGRLHWHPQRLAAQLAEIARLSEKIDFREGDALPLLPHYCDRNDCALFIDPPYSVASAPSHRHYYRHGSLDLEALFAVLAQGKAPFLMLCDDMPAVRALAARHGLVCRLAPPAADNRVHDVLITRPGDEADL